MLKTGDGSLQIHWTFGEVDFSLNILYNYKINLPSGGGISMLSNNNISKRYDGLDFAKFFCAFMVICIHMSYWGKRYFEPLTRFAVPIFFMITGYFYSSIKQNKREWIQIKKTIALFLYSNLLYLVWGIVKCVLSDESFSNLFGSILSLKAWIKFICFNESMFAGHLWYLGALIYVLVIVLAVDKYSNREKLYKFIPLFLLINVIFGNYSTIIIGVRVPLILTRNFLFCGLPFFLLGDAICKTQNRFTKKQLFVIVIISVILTIVENLFLLNSGTVFNADCFVATPFLAYSLFALFLENRAISNTPFLFMISQLGKNTSTTIYIVHPIAISIVGKIVNLLGGYIPYLNAIWYYTAPLVILISCTLFAICYNTLNRKFGHYIQIKLFSKGR